MESLSSVVLAQSLGICPFLGVSTKTETAVGMGASVLFVMTLALVIFSGIREQLALADVPKGMQGIPIALVTAGILALAFMGFAGLV